MFCPNCGRNVGTSDVFCGSCGTKIFDEKTTEPASTASTATGFVSTMGTTTGVASTMGATTSVASTIGAVATGVASTVGAATKIPTTADSSYPSAPPTVPPAHTESHSSKSVIKVKHSNKGFFLGVIVLAIAAFAIYLCFFTNFFKSDEQVIKNRLETFVQIIMQVTIKHS